MSIVLITPPPAEPVTLADLKSQLGLSPTQDTDHVQSDLLSRRLRRLIGVARGECEDITRRAFMTQTWLMQIDSFPRHDERYSGGWPHEILLPKLSFQSVAFMKYVDTDGNLQTLLQDVTHGQNPASLPYGYLLDNGSETQPARLRPLWAGPWPPTRRVPNAVQVQFKCGYGGPVTVSTSAASVILTDFVWNPGDVGQPISIPGAAASGATLATSIASVDINGQASLAVAATTAVTKATAFVGQPVPTQITQAILFLAQFYEENGASVDLPVPRIVRNLLGPYCNYMS